MARISDDYVCQSCGNVTAKWAGRCDACGEWNTIAQEASEAGPPGSLGGAPAKTKAKKIEFTSLSGGAEDIPRLQTGNGEFDRACGGGLAAGSALLIGGDPGVGKSTLLLQIAAGLSKAAIRSPIFPAKNRPGRFACAPNASTSRARPSISHRRRRCAISWRP